jgi:transposase InsO family protein
MKMCQVLEVSKSGYYRWVNRADDPEEQALRDLVKSIYDEHQGRYGYRRVHEEIRRRGLRVNKKRIARIMRELGLRGRVAHKRKQTTNSKHDQPVNANIVNQQFEVEAVNLVWLSDITYLRYHEGWLYLAVVMDLYSRRILGWELSRSMAKEVVISAFRQAVQYYALDDHLIFHSDRGVQFTATEFRDMLEQLGITQSMSGRGNCYDNAPMESFFHTLKSELMMKGATETEQMIRAMVFEYIEFYYNKKRLHSSLRYRTPDEAFFETKI